MIGLFLFTSSFRILIGHFDPIVSPDTKNAWGDDWGLASLKIKQEFIKNVRDENGHALASPLLHSYSLILN